MADLRVLLDDYARRWPAEAAVAREFAALAGAREDAYRRERLAGHFTGSAWLVSGDGERTLLTHHRQLDRWLQPGGHADGDRDLARVALREAEEESGLRGLRVEPAIFDLDRHWIPARSGLPGHWHHDVRFVVVAGDDGRYVVGDESHDLAWRDVAAIAVDPAFDASMQRMARKWLARGAD